MTAIEPFILNVPQSELDDLHRRLAMTRYPEPATVPGWAQGVPVDRLRGLVDYWRDGYDWRRCEAMLNGFGQYRTQIDGLGIHFLHIRSPHETALPLLLTHGWPGSIVEFHKVIGPLSDPMAHGGHAEDAFHLIIPCIPGFGFSDKPAEAGWDQDRIARAWAELMRRLGYTRWVAQGGDAGSVITIALARQKAAGLAGFHLNMLTPMPPPTDRPLTDEEQAAVDAAAHYMNVEAGYAWEQSTRPQTIGYPLSDSPAGQAAWIYEKFERWSGCDGDPESLFTRDELIDTIMLYWLPNAGASAARLYWETMAKAFEMAEVDLPMGFSVFPHEIFPPIRAWAERYYTSIIHWNVLPRGGHFAAFEQPALFVDEMRACFAKLR